MYKSYVLFDFEVEFNNNMNLNYKLQYCIVKIYLTISYNDNFTNRRILNSINIHNFETYVNNNTRSARNSK